MNTDLQLITPTGDREKAWLLCQKYIERQTFKGNVIWHVTDDGKSESKINFSKSGYKIIRHRLAYHGNNNTQARNLLHMLNFVDKNIPLAIIEDDDWYSAEWLRTIMDFIEQAPLIGEVQARYYNVSTRQYLQLKNNNHASLCSTAMIGDIVDFFVQVCKEGHKFIDLALWDKSGKSHRLYTHHVIGLKGVGGRQGIGMGHRDLNGKYDYDFDILKKWIGNDFCNYINKNGKNN